MVRWLIGTGTHERSEVDVAHTELGSILRVQDGKLDTSGALARSSVVECLLERVPRPTELQEPQLV